jgi:hypothetical protein
VKNFTGFERIRFGAGIQGKTASRRISDKVFPMFAHYPQTLPQTGGKLDFSSFRELHFGRLPSTYLSIPGDKRCGPKMN